MFKKLRDSRKATGRLKHTYLRKEENKWRAGDQDCQLGGHGAHIPSRKYQNTYICGTILESSRRTPVQ